MFRDAESLHQSGRLGTPDSLYGFDCECALKAILCGLGVIKGTNPKPPFREHINLLWNEYMSTQQGRTMPPLGPNPFTLWKADNRYEDDLFFSETRVEGHRNGAKEGMNALEAAALQGIVS